MSNLTTYGGRTVLDIPDDATIADVADLLTAALREEGLIDESFTSPLGWGEKRRDRRGYWETKRRGQYAWVACYAVTGSSEGHYIHVDFVSAAMPDETSRRLPVFQCKTFQGMAAAFKIANRCAELLWS